MSPDRILEIAGGAHRRQPDAIAVEQVRIPAQRPPRPPQLLERELEQMKEPRIVDDARVIDIGEPHRRHERKAHSCTAGNTSRTPHDAGTPGHGGASFSSSITTCARGYSSWIL
jgi:hypothetical protein